jgi:hypothetical protein
MYASTTSYPAIFDQAYREHRGRNFDNDPFPRFLRKFCESSGASCILEINDGQGELDRALRPHELDIFTTDFEAGASPGLLSESKTQEILTKAATSFRGGSYITTCLGILEHIDVEHIFAALKNLSSLCDEKAVVSLSTRPSARYNRFHATLLPIRTWVKLFSEAGFRVLETRHSTPATSDHNSPDTSKLDHVDRWRVVDLFADIDDGDPQYLLLEKSKAAIDWPQIQDRFSKILDIRYRTEKRRNFTWPDRERIVFNIGFAVDWAIIRPYLDILCRDQVEFLIRTTYLDPLYLNIITGWLTRVGVPFTLFQNAYELKWDRFAGANLISALESSAYRLHIRSHHVVALARLHGCRTITLQHGIWPGGFNRRLVTQAAEHLLNWTSEEARAFREGHHKVLSAAVPWGAFSEGQVKEIGSARYTDQLLEPGDDLVETRLGIDRSRFERVVLIGLKDLKYHGYGNINAGFLNELATLINQNPSTLFLLRPHPYDSISTFAEHRGPNVRLLDNMCCTMADLQLNRLIPHVDLVVTPMSTLVVDAAVSHKPIFINSTDRPLVYKGAKPRQFEDLAATMNDASQLAILKKEAAEIAAIYADAVDSQFYQKFSEFLKLPKSAGPPDAFLSATVSLCDEIEIWRSEAEHNLQSCNSAVQKYASLEQNIQTFQKGIQTLEHGAASLQAEIATLTRELKASRDQLESIFRSRSWVVARVLQKLAAGGRRIFRLS